MIKPLVILVLLGGTAAAYPQFQLSRDQTCSACHRSPAGGGLLNENGLVNAETFTQWGMAPEFFYKAITLPTWLELGGDLRGATGLDALRQSSGPGVNRTRFDYVQFPMQAELNAAATFDAFSLYVTAGARDPQYHNTAKTLFASREHWVQWQQKPGESSGLYLRAGRFMPVLGLRLAEHETFVRRYGGTPLYGEAYAATVDYIDPSWEVHATAFVHDPFVTDSIERGNGAALYAETRLATTTAIGVETKLDITPDDRKIHLGITAKQYVASAKLLVQGEVQLVNQRVDLGGTNNQLVGYVLGSYFIGSLMIDLGLGLDEPDLKVRYLDLEAADLNVHWFMTSHFEMILANRLQMQDLGAGGNSSGYSLLMAHYRL